MHRQLEGLKNGCFVKPACAGLLTAAAFAAGCKAPPAPKVSSPCQRHSAVPGYLNSMIETTGGCEAWSSISRIHGDCVVTFYGEGDTSYLTRQTHEIMPHEGTIRISSREPGGAGLWELSGTGFKTLKKPAVVARDGLPSEQCSLFFAASVLQATTGPLRLLENAELFMESAAPVKLEGRWYGSVERLTTAGSHLRAASAARVYYRAKDTGLVEVIELARGSNVDPVTVKGYDYVRIRPREVVVPSKMEIFTGDRKVAELNYYRIECR
jgi:hypothetical protein